MNKLRKVLAGVFLGVFLLMLVFSLVKKYHTKPENAVKQNMHAMQSNTEQVVISKKTVDDLVDKAAKQKYIQDVFNDDSKLPLPKSGEALQPLSANDTKAASQNNNSPVAAQRCVYNAQSYVTGDIVKTEQGWIRCTPTLIFSAEKPTVRAYGAPAWTIVQ